MVMAYGQAITQGPGGQMYTDRSMQTPYNPPQQMPKMEQHIALPPKNLENGDNLRRRQEIQPIQDMRARPPQRGIGSFPNPFGGFMGGGFGGYGMQPPMYGGGFGGFGMPPMYGGGMYGGGFGMQPPMFGGFGMQPPMYGGGFNPFSQNFYGGIGTMFPGMGGGYGMRPPMYGGGYNRPMPQPMPQPIRPMPIDRPRPIKRPMPEPMPIMRTQGPDNIGGGRPQIDRIANYSTDRRFRNIQLQPF